MEEPQVKRGRGRPRKVIEEKPTMSETQERPEDVLEIVHYHKIKVFGLLQSSTRINEEMGYALTRITPTAVYLRKRGHTYEQEIPRSQVSILWRLPS